MKRRDFLNRASQSLLLLAGPGVETMPALHGGHRADPPTSLFLCGDVMTGRGIDQVLAHPSPPRIYESYLKSAIDYVELAEKRHGPIPRAVEASYIWGDALAELERAAPEVRFINLETAVTRSGDWMPKGINYRMHPDNVDCLTAAGVDGCSLANNHILDWGVAGLTETIDTLRRAGIQTAGAGRSLREAQAPAVFDLSGGRRVLVFALGSVTSGIPEEWGASKDSAGVALLRNFSPASVDLVAGRVHAMKRAGDLVVASIHWGGNWGYRIPGGQVSFAHQLIDNAGVDVVHGHSSHHPKGIEVYRGKPILYGCGDFVNDYEGITGQEAYRSDLVLMYLLKMDRSTGKLAGLEMTPLQARRFRLNRAPESDVTWLRDRLDRECARLGTGVGLTSEGRLTLRWS